MKNPFQRRRLPPVPLALGGALMASRLGPVAPTASVVPAGCIGVAVDASGQTRRVADGARLALAAGEYAWCFHPGPYALTLTPFAAAPEMGLQLRVVVDSPDPRVPQQRFDLFLASEGEQTLTLAQFCAGVDTALQHALAQGHLDLPPCTVAHEWNAFRAGLNELLYTRFGVTVDECIPVDLAGQVDYAALLAARAVAGTPMPMPMPTPMPASVPLPDIPIKAAPDPARSDAAALRRLFLELPAVTRRLRQIDTGAGAFARQQALVQRFDHAALAVLTMPALALAAPGQALGAGLQQQRVHHARRANSALDEAWAWLARAGAQADAGLLDDGERIAANLEQALAARRATAAP